MLNINGHSLYVELRGPEDGPVVILLHHGLGSVKAWSGQVSALVEAGFKVVVYDRWGYGGSDPRLQLDLPDFTTDLEDLAGLLDALHIERASLVGHSDGGTIALYFAALQPHYVNSLVTIAAHIYVEPDMEPGLLGIRQAFESDARFRKGMRLAHGDKFKSVFYNWFNGWHRHEILTWDMRPQLSQVRCPLLVVQGEQDEYASPQHARDIASAVRGAELWLLPGARHMLPQENPAVFNTRITGFLKTLVISGSFEVV